MIRSSKSALLAPPVLPLLRVFGRAFHRSLEFDSVLILCVETGVDDFLVDFGAILIYELVEVYGGLWSQVAAIAEFFDLLSLDLPIVVGLERCLLHLLLVEPLFVHGRVVFELFQSGVLQEFGLGGSLFAKGFVEFVLHFLVQVEVAVFSHVEGGVGRFFFLLRSVHGLFDFLCLVDEGSHSLQDCVLDVIE